MAEALWRWYDKRGPRPWVAAVELRCQHYGALPFAGGIVDQPDELMALLELVSVVKQYHDIPLNEYGKLSPEVFSWIDRISGKRKLPENQ